VEDRELDEFVALAVRLLGDATLSAEEVESSLRGLVKDPTLARRLIDWIPEAFAYALVSHSWNVKLPKRFKVENRQGDWESFEFQCEPCFASAIRAGLDMYHSGPREQFGRIASKSATLASINKALNAGAEINGAELGALKMFGIPAEFYREERG
jgi:hypothetical protein